MGFQHTGWNVTMKVEITKWTLSLIDLGRKRSKSEDFRSLLNTNSRENSEIIIETAKLINSEITSQVSKKLNELKRDLNTEILDSINLARSEKVLAVIQNTMESNDRVWGICGPQVQ